MATLGTRLDEHGTVRQQSMFRITKLEEELWEARTYLEEELRDVKRRMGIALTMLIANLAGIVLLLLSRYVFS